MDKSLRLTFLDHPVYRHLSDHTNAQFVNRMLRMSRMPRTWVSAEAANR